MTDKRTLLITKKLNGAKTYESLETPRVEGSLSLYDPMTQICKRLEAFFKADPWVHCTYLVNNHKVLGPKIDPDTGTPYTRKLTVDDEQVDAIIDQEQLCEFRLYVDDYEKAQCMSNVIRHRHVYTEVYEADSDGSFHIRDHILIVHVMCLNAVDPDGEGGGIDPYDTGDDTDKGLKEIYGLEPINWEDTNTGCNDRLAPNDASGVDLPKGFPEEYEQRQWADNPFMRAWKWKWFQKAVVGNSNITKCNYEYNDGRNVWRFVECAYLPVEIPEDNLTSVKGYTCILAADMLPFVFSLFGEFQISTMPRGQ